ncbi:Dabb family protein [Cellulosilyticum sp. I15G10I2]|uniref:Dabb family protein n=1 Tax=Cellulosilyticum sp. I15G10I2 TaxID=1892843 RepID=UPI00085C979B|nr:Dabb family protein [Cellulosilyticum sp. I15G10I2]
MVKHIVMWQVADHDEHGKKQDILIKMKQQLEALKGQIEGLIDLEVGFNFNPGDMAYDIALYSVLEDKEALGRYQQHPKHLEVADNLVRQVAIKRVVVDYEI